MTDNEIIEDLRGSILNAKLIDCKAWSVELYKIEETLDLINRQKAENEELKDILEKVPTNAYDLQVEASEKLENQIKSEAIKSFAERLKRKRIALKSEEPVFDLLKVGAIDDLVKEMTEVEDKQRKEDEGK